MRTVDQAIPLHRFDLPSPHGNLPFEISLFEKSDPMAWAGYPHRHGFYEIDYITAGQGTHVIDFEAYDIRPVTLYFISPGQVHFWQAFAPLRGRLILFTDEFLLLDPMNRSVLHELAFFHSLGDAPQLRLTPDQVEPIAALIQDLTREYESLEYSHASALRAYLHILLVKIQRLYATPHTPPSGDSASALVRQFKRLVSEHYAERSVQAYADQLGVSAGHLADTVKAVTGHAPGHVIRQTLALEAKRLLTHTDLTIAQISHRLSFDDPAYFGRFFKRETGASPGHFRQYIRKKYQNLQV